MQPQQRPPWVGPPPPTGQPPMQQWNRTTLPPMQQQAHGPVPPQQGAPFPHPPAFAGPIRRNSFGGPEPLPGPSVRPMMPQNPSLGRVPSAGPPPVFINQPTPPPRHGLPPHSQAPRQGPSPHVQPPHGPPHQGPPHYGPARLPPVAPHPNGHPFTEKLVPPPEIRGHDVRDHLDDAILYTALHDTPERVGYGRHFQLKQVHQKRHTEILCIMTMYNEDDDLFHRTFDAVLRNIENLEYKHPNSKTWGKDAWKKVVVCIISDGRAKCDARTKALLTLYGAYIEQKAEMSTRGSAQVEAHVFETTTHVRIDRQGRLNDPKRATSHLPIQVLVCMKEKNQQKLNSHRWAFDAFAKQLNPRVCILLDVGTQPSDTSLYHLWKAFDKHANVGGCCGEITVDLGHLWHLCINPLVAAQRFEYKMSNILDKPLESVFGFISVLPGAFSAYRWQALQGAPLDAYFLGETMHTGGGHHKHDNRSRREKAVSLATTNMYLAEDRILCFELIVKQHTLQDPHPRWVLKYVKSAKASTDAPDKLPEFIMQRRRWNNGSFFASLYATMHFHRIWLSNHSFLRKLAFSFEFFYNMVVLAFGYIGLSSFYLAFYFICTSSTANASADPFFGAGATVVGIVSKIYVGVIGVTIICALGNRPDSSKWYYYLCCICFALLFAMALFCTTWSIYLSVPHSSAGWRDFFDLLDQQGFRNIVIAILSTYGVYLLSSLIFLDPWHCIVCIVQYCMMSPAYICILPIYAFSNLHDLAWGTKGSSTAGASAQAGQAAEDEKKRAGPHILEGVWHEAQKELRIFRPKQPRKRSDDKRKADHYQNVRTNSLLIYLGVNLAIVMWFTSDLWGRLTAGDSSAGSSTNYYIVGIFWTVAVMAAIRFLGSLLYIITFYAGF